MSPRFLPATTTSSAILLIFYHLVFLYCRVRILTFYDHVEIKNKKKERVLCITVSLQATAFNRAKDKYNNLYSP